MNDVSINSVRISSIPWKPTGLRLLGEVLELFPQVFSPPSVLPVLTGSANYHISTSSPPVHAKIRRLAPDKLKIVRAEFELGITGASNGAPPHGLKKSGD